MRKLAAAAVLIVAAVTMSACDSSTDVYCAAHPNNVSVCE